MVQLDILCEFPADGINDIYSMGVITPSSVMPIEHETDVNVTRTLILFRRD
jgi:hypothetical protein